MTDFLDNLATRSFDPVADLRPRLASRFEQPAAAPPEPALETAATVPQGLALREPRPDLLPHSAPLPHLPDVPADLPPRADASPRPPAGPSVAVPPAILDQLQDLERRVGRLTDPPRLDAPSPPAAPSPPPAPPALLTPPLPDTPPATSGDSDARPDARQAVTGQRMFEPQVVARREPHASPPPRDEPLLRAETIVASAPPPPVTAVAPAAATPAAPRSVARQDLPAPDRDSHGDHRERDRIEQILLRERIIERQQVLVHPAPLPRSAAGAAPPRTGDSSPRSSPASAVPQVEPLLRGEPRQTRAPEPVVHVTIGRVEVRTAAPAATRAPALPAGESRVMTLDQYLAVRQGGAG